MKELYETYTGAEIFTRNESCHLDGCRDFINNYIEQSYSNVPGSIQPEIYFFLNKYCRLSEKREFDFLSYFHSPVWSIVYHLAELFIPDAAKREDVLIHGLAAQGLALYLHSFDDHLCDGDIPLSHSLLLYRNTLWNDYLSNLNKVKSLFDFDDDIFNEYLDKFSRGISSHDRAESLSEYFYSFKLTMKLGAIVPFMILKNSFLRKEDVKSILDSLYSFGLAWRIQDDIDDINSDMMNNKKTSVYFLIDEGLKKKWHEKKSFNASYKSIYTSGAIKELISYSNVFINFSVKIAESYGLNNLKEEYANLLIEDVF